MEKIAISRFVTKEFQAAEALKTLRTNLLFSGADVKAVALTSFSASEGKSSISFQLAASLALAGKRNHPQMRPHLFPGPEPDGALSRLQFHPILRFAAIPSPRHWVPENPY